MFQTTSFCERIASLSFSQRHGTLIFMITDSFDDFAIRSFGFSYLSFFISTKHKKCLNGKVLTFWHVWHKYWARANCYHVLLFISTHAMCHVWFRNGRFGVLYPNGSWRREHNSAWIISHRLVLILKATTNVKSAILQDFLTNVWRLQCLLWPCLPANWNKHGAGSA